MNAFASLRLIGVIDSIVITVQLLRCTTRFPHDFPNSPFFNVRFSIFYIHVKRRMLAVSLICRDFDIGQIWGYPALAPSILALTNTAATSGTMAFPYPRSCSTRSGIP